MILTLEGSRPSDTAVLSRVCFRQNEMGVWTLLTETKKAQTDLASAYANAIQTGSWTGEVDISRLVTENGATQHTFLLPDGKSVRSYRGLSLGSHIKTCTATKVVALSSSEVILYITATKIDGSTRHSVVRVGNGTVTSGSTSDLKAAEVSKGFAFDRYLAHLVARAGISAVSDKSYRVSTITQEIMEPNISAPHTIIHGKWGNDGQNTLTYALQYARLIKHLALDLRLVLVVASERNVQALQEQLSLASRSLQISIDVLNVEDFVDRLGLAIPVKEAARREIVALDNAATHGHTDWIQERTYDPTLPHASRPYDLTDEPDWKEHLQALPALEVSEELAKLRSSYWEYYPERYHVNLAMRLSYLYEERHEFRDAIGEIFPELRELGPNLYALLERSVASSSGGTDEGAQEGSTPNLKAFSLREYVERFQGRSAAVNIRNKPPQNLRSQDSCFTVLNEAIKDVHDLKGILALPATILGVKERVHTRLSQDEVESLLISVVAKVVAYSGYEKGTFEIPHFDDLLQQLGEQTRPSIPRGLLASLKGIKMAVDSVTLGL